MKVEIKESNQKKEREFPKLMKSSLGTIVFFASYGKGTQISVDETDEYNIKQGDYFEGWIMSVFTDFEGSITISND